MFDKIKNSTRRREKIMHFKLNAIHNEIEQVREAIDLIETTEGRAKAFALLNKLLEDLEALDLALDPRDEGTGHV